jgi:hypothetical protein
VFRFLKKPAERCDVHANTVLFTSELSNGDSSEKCFTVRQKYFFGRPYFNFFLHSRNNFCNIFLKLKLVASKKITQLSHVFTKIVYVASAIIAHELFMKYKFKLVILTEKLCKFFQIV